MEIVLLHLSDLHINSNKDPVLNRAENIGRSTFVYLPNAIAVFIVVSGDIAYSGLPDQNDQAQIFLHKIRDVILTEKKIPIYMVMVPGNHDCDHSYASSVRDAVLTSIENDGEASIDEAKITECVKVQTAFEAFRERMTQQETLHKKDPLWMQYLIKLDEKEVLFDCLNVSWMSRKHETPGHLLFPSDRYRQLKKHAATLRILVLHHPLNWYHQASYHKFRILVRSVPNIVLTGHEHVAGTGEINDAINDQSVYVEGAALQPHSDEKAGPPPTTTRVERAPKLSHPRCRSFTASVRATPGSQCGAAGATEGAGRSPSALRQSPASRPAQARGLDRQPQARGACPW